jgi:glycosyltransferase involved in cell wall biosynthesis
MREKISACITCFNEEEKIQCCLQSLTWCDEIVVVDSFSTDRTPDICREFTDRVYQHEWLGYIGQKNWARDRARHPWILFLDADEEVSGALRDEILAEFEKGTGDYVGYQFARQVFYLGRWIRHGAWYPDIKLRLFRKDCGHSAGREPHDHVEVDGPVKMLKGRIWHYTYDDINDQIRQFNRFSTITAEEKFARGVRFSFADLFFRPYWRFFKGYVLRGGFLDGFAGFVIAVLGAVEVFVKYAKLRELELVNKGQSGRMEAGGDKSKP